MIEIVPFLQRIGWKGTPKEYFIEQYEFESTYIDFGLIERIQILRKCGIKCYIASNQNYFRKAFLIRKMRLFSQFDGAFFSCDFGVTKPEKAYWERVVDQVRKYKPLIDIMDILFLDDMKENIESARSFGLKSIQIENSLDIERVIIELGA